MELRARAGRHLKDRDEEACWHAADQLTPVEDAYVKLLMLLGPRKSALAGMRRADLDNADNPSVWVTPFELVKVKKSSTKKRTYTAAAAGGAHLETLAAVRQRIGVPRPAPHRLAPSSAPRSSGGSSRPVRRVTSASTGGGTRLPPSCRRKNTRNGSVAWCSTIPVPG